MKRASISLALFTLTFAALGDAETNATQAAEQRPYVIEAGAGWVPITEHRDILEGSALDFSKAGFTDAPAGKYGWIRSVGGHFEFEKLPGRPQRFYGVNLCGTANFPDHDLADKPSDILLAQLVRDRQAAEHGDMGPRGDDGREDAPGRSVDEGGLRRVHAT